MKAAILTAPNAMALGDAPDPTPADGDLVLRVKAATICGTDIRIYRGRKTAGIRYPSIIGHEFSGEIVAGDATFRPGQRVAVCPSIPCGHCVQCLRGRENLCPEAENIGYEIDGAFAELIRIPARAVRMGNVHHLPDSIGHAQAALIEPLACVLNGQNKVELAQGDTVVVLGSGPIGTLHIKLARLRGAARVIVSEPNPGRRAAAIAAGADVGIDPTTEDLRARVREETGGLGADVVICAIGIPALASQAITLAGYGGRVSLFAGFAGGEMGHLDVNAIHYDELRVTGSFGLSRLDYATALGIVATQRIDTSDMITHSYSLAEMDEAIGMAEGGKAMKVAILDA
ncbi:MAG: alcohol dehydrogenase catalytic domain-containing protein [Amaricoccus sp.]